MILVDANILMYAAGADHPNKTPSADFLRQVACDQVEAALDAEILQEILHRYRAIKRWSEGRQVYEAARRLFPAIFPITVDTLDSARELMDRYPSLGARDALHAAVALRHSAQAICSYDRNFDQIEDLRRVEPGQLAQPAET